MSASRLDRQAIGLIEADQRRSADMSEAYFARMIGVPFYAVMPRATSSDKIAAIEHYGGNCHFSDDGRTLYDEAAALALRLGGHYLDQFTFAERATDSLAASSPPALKKRHAHDKVF